MILGNYLRKLQPAKREPFDPIAARDELRRLGKLTVIFTDVPSQMPDGVFRHFTELDPRLYALWQISMFYQFQPADLKTLTDDDLLFLAGQSPEGYSDDSRQKINHDKNKVTQNALRAKVELERRAIGVSWRRTLYASMSTVVATALLTALATALATAWLIGPPVVNVEVQPAAEPTEVVNVPVASPTPSPPSEPVPASTATATAEPTTE